MLFDITPYKYKETMEDSSANEVIDEIEDDLSNAQEDISLTETNINDTENEILEDDISGATDSISDAQTNINNVSDAITTMQEIINTYNEPFVEGNAAFGTGISDAPLANNSEFKIDRVNISGKPLSATYTGKPDEFLYCIGGNITCPSGNEPMLEETENYTLANGGGKSYNYYCIDRITQNQTATHVKCEGGKLQPDKPITIKSSCTEDASYQEITFMDITSDRSETKLVGSDLTGFTDPFSYIPLTTDSSFVYLYNETEKELFKGDFCFLNNDSSLCCPDNDSSSSCVTPQTIKCLANNSAQIGDPLCCGQTGVVQNTKHNCPSEYPNCVGYKCGETWGKCTSDTSAQ
jgi:phage protein U